MQPFCFAGLRNGPGLLDEPLSKMAINKLLTTIDLKELLVNYAQLAIQ
jgi:hypothetical protein